MSVQPVENQYACERNIQWSLVWNADRQIWYTLDDQLQPKPASKVTIDNYNFFLIRLISVML